MNTRKTSCRRSATSINHSSTDCGSSDTPRPSAEGDKRVCGFSIGGWMENTISRLESMRLWRKENPEYHKNYNKEYRELPWVKTRHNINSRVNGLTHYSHKKGIKNFLSVSDLKFLWFRDKAYLLSKPSIDRIDPKLHYTIKNCRYIELSENLKRRFKSKN